MKLGSILVWSNDTKEFRRHVRLADNLGYSVVGVSDSPAHAQDMGVALAVAAMETDHVTLAPMVTSPILRHPLVTASVLSGIHELSGGRVIAAIGTGGSAMAAIGREPASLDTLRTFTSDVRNVLTGEKVQVGGRTTYALMTARPMPVYLAAEGPRSLRLAGEIADGVITSVGMDIDHVANKIAIVRESAERVGRDPAEIDFWGMGFVAIRDNKAQANADISPFLTTITGMGLSGPYMSAHVPEQHRWGIAELARRHNPHRFYSPGEKPGGVAEELGLLDYLVGLNGVTGSVDEVHDYLEALDDCGVTCLLAAMLPGSIDPEGTLVRLAQANGQQT
ncbi:MAG TPA: LLM class flavin-dependent oxidoreductase [Pseudonocardiaceae bacterium]|jgi:alkanesulfonate monooxygenase SsuD/methylene tetrahydromethanopterin reductase-like flavin-dependent oxidoreductase (luciferase family)